MYFQPGKYGIFYFRYSAFRYFCMGLDWFFMVGKMKESFNIATPYEFLSMSVIGIGLIITYWVSWLGWLLVLIGMLGRFYSF